MDRQEAKELLKNMEPSFLTQARAKVNGHITYICPNSTCGNGSGSSGTGIALDIKHLENGKHYKCFNCGLYEDIIGLWKIHSGTTDDRQAFKELYNYYSLQVDSKQEYQKEARTEHTHAHTYTHNEEKEEKPVEIDRRPYYKACMEQLSNTDYLKNRGLSEATIAKYKLGYDAHFTTATGGREWQALIIPTNPSSFVARNTDREADKKDRYRKVGSSNLYLSKTLQNATSPIVITEGELDALSIIEAGGEAVALGSTANYGKLLEAVKKEKPAQLLVLALDNDEDGEATSQTLKEELTKLEIPFYRCNLYGTAKDANEALIADRQALMDAVQNIKEQAQKEAEAEKEAIKEEYRKTSVASYLQAFVNGIADSVNTPYIPTGFKELDKILDGGLYEGLYTVGAVSSLGKTTLILQIADQIAEAGQDVLIFSLEMARTELMAKSISRLTLLDILQNNGKINNAKTTRGITTGVLYKNYSQTELALIQEAVRAYGEYAGNIFIEEGMGNIGVEEVKNKIENHISLTGSRPVVVIDYIQLLASPDSRLTDKQVVDKNILELKRISRDCKVPVIGISSVNRASYKTKASMEMLKESGSLEFSSDVIWGLQFKGVETKEFDVDEAKDKNPREIELVVLKNRNGATGKTIEFEYYPMFNYFKEIGLKPKKK